MASPSFAAELFLEGFSAGDVVGVFPLRDIFCIVWVV